MTKAILGIVLLQASCVPAGDRYPPEPGVAAYARVGADYLHGFAAGAETESFLLNAYFWDRPSEPWIVLLDEEPCLVVEPAPADDDLVHLSVAAIRFEGPWGTETLLPKPEAGGFYPILSLDPETFLSDAPIRVSAPGAQAVGFELQGTLPNRVLFVTPTPGDVGAAPVAGEPFEVAWSPSAGEITVSLGARPLDYVPTAICFVSNVDRFEIPGGITAMLDFSEGALLAVRRNREWFDGAVTLRLSSMSSIRW